MGVTPSVSPQLTLVKSNISWLRFVRFVISSAERFDDPLYHYAEKRCYSSDLYLTVGPVYLVEDLGRKLSSAQLTQLPPQREGVDYNDESLECRIGAPTNRFSIRQIVVIAEYLDLFCWSEELGLVPIFLTA